MNLDQYEREGRTKYAAFAKAVASIVAAAINNAGGYRLQQVVERAKHPDSLRKKLQDRGLQDTDQLESEIKDLAGCRIVFYTNIDVTRLVSADIIRQNFVVQDVKLHHPGQIIGDVAELYTSNHYILSLGPDRLALPEYAPFAGLRCELQVQTILNHAWAGMAHDTVYKVPELGSFGVTAFENIGHRLAKVARRYLVPAGYEFQKIVSDFDRLIEGKALFDNDALEAIVDAADNNARIEALERLSENVLPLYDDLPKIYPAVVARLLEAADRAQACEPVAVETPYGTLPAKTYGDVLVGIVAILERYRYLDVAANFHALCDLYLRAETDSERKPLAEAGKKLAKHNLSIWREFGQAVENTLADCISGLPEQTRARLISLLAPLLTELLSCEATSENWSSTAVTFQQGVLPYSQTLEQLRARAIELLERQYQLCTDDDDRDEVIRALLAGTRTPYRGSYSNELMSLILRNTASVIRFLAGIAPHLSYSLRQSAEDRVHRLYWANVGLPPSMQEDVGLVEASTQVQAAALTFRDAANADQEFGIYKVLMGYESVFPPEWANGKLDFEAKRAYRESEATALLATVGEATSDLWYRRLEECAKTRSRDLADSWTLLPFLVKLAARQPQIALTYIGRLVGAMESYLPWLIDGLMNSNESAQMRRRIDAWLESGQHFKHLAWYLRFAKPFDAALLEQVLRRAMDLNDNQTVRICLAAADMQYSAPNPNPILQVFIRAVEWLAERGDFTWINAPMTSWYQRPIALALDEGGATRLLNALVAYPEIDTNADQLIGTIATIWPAQVITYLGQRCALERDGDRQERYVAIPFETHELAEPLRTAIAPLVAAARDWFAADPDLFPYRGARIVSAVFPRLQYGLREQLITLVQTGDDETIRFVLNVLLAYHGEEEMEEIVRIAVSRVQPESDLLEVARSVLRESGVVRGEYGFVELYTARKDRMVAWLEDPSEQIRQFASAWIRELELWIASENRSAEAMQAMRRLAHDEDLIQPETDDSPSDGP